MAARMGRMWLVVVAYGAGAFLLERGVLADLLIISLPLLLVRQNARVYSGRGLSAAGPTAAGDLPNTAIAVTRRRGR